MSAIKAYKKGEIIAKEGDRPSCLYLIQSGNVQVTVSRGKTNIEFFQLSTSQIIGEAMMLSNTTQHIFTYTAQTEVRVIEVPVDPLKIKLDQSDQMIRVLTKSLLEKLKLSLNDLRSIKLEKDNNPCPQDHIAKVFGTIFHIVKLKGIEKDNKITMDFNPLKQYAQRVFLENPKRIEGGILILAKLKLYGMVIG